MSSLAGSAFLENFQMPMCRGTSVSWRPAGPPGVRWWLIVSAVGGFICLATMYALTGVLIQPAVPCGVASLLVASSHYRTSWLLQCRNTFFSHPPLQAIIG